VIAAGLSAPLPQFVPLRQMRNTLMAIQHPANREKALQKLRHYCAYQERSHQEVKAKLQALGVWKNDQDQIMAQLIEENYLNEERFAIQFSGGKFRTRQWGKLKIQYALKQKQVSDYCIHKALSQIDPGDYMDTLQRIAHTKWNALSDEQNSFSRAGKLRNYLYTKGYEPALVHQTIQTLIR
jgi:regulatory protein